MSIDINLFAAMSRSMAPSMYLLAMLFLLLEYSFTAKGSNYSQHIIYVHHDNGTMDSSCWTGGEDLPCATLDLALHGAEQIQPSIVFVKDECKCTSHSINVPGVLTNETQISYEDQKMCPWTWSRPGTCECGDDLNYVVSCNSTIPEVAVIDCYCITYDKVANRSVAGACFYNCESNSHSRNSFYRPLPWNVFELNEAMCGHLNRKGQLCGQCKDGFFPSVYSYYTQCVNCSGVWNSRITYAIAVALPPTIFFVLVCVFRISATSPQLHAFVFVSHVLATSTSVRIVTGVMQIHKHSKTAILIVATLYGIWNLDFFRTILPPICFNVTTLQALALDYITAFYPLALCVTTYLLSVMYSNNFRLIVWLWRPFDKCFSRFRQQWDVRTSSIDALATFLLLAYTKLINVSGDLLIPTEVFNVSGKTIGFYLYYDANIKYFGKQHLPYAILALTIGLFLIILPLTILCLYPTRLFRNCHLQPGTRYHVLYVFLNAFQGCYMNGTDGKRDTRYFAATYLLARIILAIVYGITLTEYYFALGLVVLILLALFIAIIKPYQNAIYNRVDTVLILLLAMIYSSILSYNIASAKESRFIKPTLLITFIVAVVPLVYLFIICLYWILTRRLVQDKLLYGTRIHRWINKRGSSTPDTDIPYRMLDSENSYDTAALSTAMLTGD